jgi:hypothetical protein
MLEDKFLQIRIRSLIHKTLLIKEEVITDSAADISMSDTLDSSNTLIQLEKTLMRTVHILARTWEKTRLASALRAKLRILALHAIHIRSRSTHIRNIAGKARKSIQGSDFPDDGLLATGLDELALMSRDGTEITTAEASPMSIDRKLDHLECRNMLALIARMRQFSERKIPDRIHLLLRGRREGRVDLNITITHRLDKHRRIHHIRISLDHMEILRKSRLILAASLERIENDRILMAASAVHIETDLRYLSDIIEIPSGLDSLGKLYHRPLPHSITEPVSTTLDKNRRLQTILPIIIMSETSQ